MSKLQTKRQSTWNLSPLFSSDNDPRIETQRKKVEKEIKKFVSKWKKRNDYLSNATALKTALGEYERLMRLYGAGGASDYYFWLRTMQDQTSTDLKAKLSKAEEFSIKMGSELQFFKLRLAKISPSKQKELLKNRGLRLYKHFLEKIFKRAKYVLSEEEEKIINLMSDPAYSKWTQMVSTFLSKEEREVIDEQGKKEKKNLEQLSTLTTSSNKKVRDVAGEAINDILKKHVEVAEAEINAVMAHKKIDDELRGVKRPDFFRHLNDNVETEVVDTLISTVSKRYSIAKRFYTFKAKLIGVKKLKYHERNIEYKSIDKPYSFRETSELIDKVFNRLDTEFANIFRSFISMGQIDVYPKRGKRGGAFCAHWLMTQPTYILLNFTNKLRDVTTLAHELGHGINNELMKQKQHSLHFGTPMATAEVASTFMEDFVLQKLLKETDDEMKLGFLLTKLNDDISAIFRQIACYQFEQELHRQFREKGYLSHQEIGKIFQKYMTKYMGDAVEQSKGSENWWVHWWHIRTYFYVYSYASGLLISKSLQRSVKKDPAFIQKVKTFLSAGLSDSPKNIFKNMDIDITDRKFWDKGLDEIENALKDTEKLAKKLGKLS